VVYTYTDVIESIDLKLNYQEYLAETALKRKNDVVNKLDAFINNSKQECLIFKFSEEACKHLKLIKFLVESILEKMKKSFKVKKSLVFVIHI